MKKLLGFFLLAGLFLPQNQLFAQTALPRTITVSGEASMQAAPDQAILSMSLVSKNISLTAAKQHNDAMVEKLVNITKNLQIPKENIATSNVNISPEYSYNNNQQTFIGYTVNRSLRVTMNKLDLPEKLLSAIVDAKIDQVNGIQYDVAKPEAYAAELRIKAFEDAKTKAAALATAAGSKLGPAITIATDGNSAQPPVIRPMAMMAKSAMAESSIAPSLPGMLELQESVTVTFGLE